MKKLIIIIINSTIIIISGILICFFSLPSKIDIVAEDSFFSDYEVINDEVMFYCTITFKNDYNEDKVINIFASSDEDIETGLLAEARMPGYKSDDFESVFLIPASSTRTYNVVFVGQYGGTSVKHDRLLPNIEIQET